MTETNLNLNVRKNNMRMFRIESESYHNVGSEGRRDRTEKDGLFSCNSR
jgi:hypothetical protein